MLTNCNECGGKARIRSSKTLSENVRDLYCQCTDVQCSHSFVMTLSFTRTISPSRKQADRLLFDNLVQLSRAEQTEMFSKLEQARV